MKVPGCQWIIPWFLLGVGSVLTAISLAAEETNVSPAPVTTTNSVLAAPELPVKDETDPVARRVQAEQCLEDLRLLMDILLPIEEQARAGSELERAACLGSKLERLKGLLKLGERALDVMKASRPEDEAQVIESELAKIEIVCRRATQLGREIEGCTGGLSPRDDAVSSVEPILIPSAPPPVPPWLQRTDEGPRTPQTCLRRGALACLLARAAGFELETEDPVSCLGLLEQESILTGESWDPQACASIDDLAVAAVRLLGLKVADPQDGLACLGALRAHGLPVDTDLPARMADTAPPLLLEGETRSFLVRGLAAPLPSARPVMPY